MPQNSAHLARSNSSNHPLRSSFSLVALLLAAVCTTAQAESDVEIRSEDGLLSIQTNNASAARLAEVLSDELDIDVYVTGDAEVAINIDIVDVPMEKALIQLSPNHMLVRDGKDADSNIIELVLMMGDGTDQSAGGEQFLPSGASDEAFSNTGPNNESGAAGGVEQATQFPTTQEFIDPATGVPTDPNTGLPLKQ